MNIQSYFEKIQFQNIAKPDYETLTQLVKLQTRFIPFEDVDALTGTSPSLQMNLFLKNWFINSVEVRILYF